MPTRMHRDSDDFRLVQVRAQVLQETKIDAWRRVLGEFERRLKSAKGKDVCIYQYGISVAKGELNDHAGAYAAAKASNACGIRSAILDRNLIRTRFDAARTNAEKTAALEAALYKKPMVVGYKMPALTGMIMQKKALIRHVSLPNILLGENVVPEFLQYFCEADQISYALEDALANDAKRAMLVERFTKLHESLKADTANLAADVITTIAARKPAGF